MGIDPEKLATSSVSITGVNGKELQSQTRQMHVRIINTSNQEESWEKVYVSEEIKVSLVSKDCLIRLKVLFDCEKSFFKNKDGSIGCQCEKRTLPPDFEEEFYEAIFDVF